MLGGSSHLEVCAHSLKDLASGREDTDGCECPGIDNGCAVDEYLEFAVTAANHLNIDLQRPPDQRRHTDRRDTRDSICAVSDRHPSHEACSSDFSCRFGLPLPVVPRPWGPIVKANPADEGRHD